MYYIVMGNWYVWALRPAPHNHLLYGVWTSGYFGLPSQQVRQRKKKAS